MNILKTCGMANYNLRNYKKAINNFNLALDIEEDGEIYYYRGLTNYKLKNFIQARIDFKKAIKLKANIEIKYYEKIPKFLKLFM